MEEAIQRLVEGNYSLTGAAIQPLSTAPGAISHSWLATTQQGKRWVLHLYREGWREVVAPHESLTRHVTGLGELLGWLDTQGYPVPPILRTRDGAASVGCGEWCALAAGFVTGAQAEYTLPAIEALGALVGRLHQLSLPPSPIDSWWALETVVPIALERLIACEAIVTPEWQGWHRDCRATLEAALRLADLPTAILHADAWLGNTLCPTPDSAILIDWECAGRGPAILDFGSLVLHAHYDRPDYTPDAERIAALATGYSRQRRLTPKELATLPLAVQFGPAYRSALFFFRAQQRGWNEPIERQLRREQERFAPSRTLGEAMQATLGDPPRGE